MDAATYVIGARRAAGLTQRELARKAGVPQPAIARIERGQQVPRFDTLTRILEACDFEVCVARRGGVDPSLIAEMLDRSVAERAVRATAYGRFLDRLRNPGQSAYRGFDPADALECLGRHGVRFVLVGGLAAATYGAEPLAAVIELCDERTPENAERLEAGLAELAAVPRAGHSVDEVRALSTSAGPIDLISGFPEVDALAYTHDLGNGLSVRVASLDDLIRMGTLTIAEREQEDRR